MAIKITKKARKQLSRNDMVRRSKEASASKRMSLGNSLYFGAPPQYAKEFNELGMLVGYKKVAVGVPFVRDTYDK